MTENLGNANVCPTRIDGGEALFAHQVSRGQCQSRQRDSFHKCFTCVHNNAYAAAHGGGSGPKKSPEKAPRLKPAKKAASANS